jgi:hypothetical protein
MVGCAAVALGFVGVFLPVLPTTPFLLVAAWAFARSSPRLSAWLEAHRRFGQFLRDWREHRAIPVRAKLLAAAGMTASWFVLLWRTDGWLAPALGGALMLAVASYVLTRPSGPPRPLRGEPAPLWSPATTTREAADDGRGGGGHA